MLHMSVNGADGAALQTQHGLRQCAIDSVAGRASLNDQGQGASPRLAKFPPSPKNRWVNNSDVNKVQIFHFAGLPGSISRVLSLYLQSTLKTYTAFPVLNISFF